MRIHRYWASAEYQGLGYGRSPNEPFWGKVYRGSDVSVEDAAERAQAAAEDLTARGRVHAAIAQGWYAYEECAKPEAIERDVFDESGRRAAAITINRHGCLVLNTATMPFVDVDLPEPTQSPAKPRRFFGIFGGNAPRVAGPSSEAAADAALERLVAWLAPRPGIAARVYRTHSGLRYLMLGEGWDPVSEVTRDTLEQLGADPLYTRLCRAQACFRARLTPKPWRVKGCKPTWLAPPNEQGEPPGIYFDWRKGYDKACQEYATCALLDVFGHAEPATDHEDQIVVLHDDATRAMSGLPLA